MVAAFLRFMLSVILSPRRILVAALFATFFYAALVATKARFLPESALRGGSSVAAAPARSRFHGAPAPGGTHTE